MDVNSENEWFGMAADQATEAVKHFHKVRSQFDEVIETWKANPPYPISLSTFTKLVVAHSAIDKTLRDTYEVGAKMTLDELGFSCRDVLEKFNIPVAYKIEEWDYETDPSPSEEVWESLLKKRVGDLVAYGGKSLEYVIGFRDDEPEDRKIWLVEPQYIDPTG